MYTNYIFDLYGTLIDISTDENSPELWDKLSLFYSFKGAYYSSDELKLNYEQKVKEEKDKITDTDYPDIVIENVFTNLFLDKGIVPNKTLVEDTCHFFRITSCKYIKLYPHVLDLLNELKSKNKKIFLLSNAQRVFTLFEMNYLGITKYFDDILFSSDYNVCKPDKKFFKELLSRHNLSVKTSVMIGNDSEADIKGAYNVDLPSLYIHSNLSPEIVGNLYSTYSILNSDFSKIAPLIIK